MCSNTNVQREGRKRVRHRWGVVLSVAFLLAHGSVPAHGASPEQVRRTIDKAKAYLYAQQKSDSTWESPFDIHGDQKTGQTALAVYALLSSGDSHEDSRLTKAIAYLKKTETNGVYALGVRCQVWLALPPAPGVGAAGVGGLRGAVSSHKSAG